MRTFPFRALQKRHLPKIKTSENLKKKQEHKGTFTCFVSKQIGMSLEDWHDDPIQRNERALSSLINVVNPFEYFSTDESTKNVKCAKCKLIPNMLYHTSVGSLFCLDCVIHFRDGPQVCIDRRLQKMLRFTEVKCHLHTKGCEWKGNIQTFAEHLLGNCDFAKKMCNRCEEIVCAKDLCFHKETDECKYQETVKKKCRFGCGYVDSILLMKIHTFDKCPKLKEDERRQRRDDKDFTVPFDQECHDAFEIELRGLDRCDQYERLLLQNELPIELCVVRDQKSSYFHMYFTLFRTDHTHSVVETLKKTKVIVTVVNKNKTFPDHAARDYKFVLPFRTNNNCSCYFSKLYVMKEKDMLTNSETKTCYLDADGLDLKIDFQYPNKFPMF